jgi:hypothetical protein
MSRRSAEKAGSTSKEATMVKMFHNGEEISDQYLLAMLDHEFEMLLVLASEGRLESILDDTDDRAGPE